MRAPGGASSPLTGPREALKEVAYHGAGFGEVWHFRKG